MPPTATPPASSTKHREVSEVIGGGCPPNLKNLEIAKRNVPILLAQGEKDDPDGAHQAV